MKLLAYSDYVSATGFSIVLSNILQRLPKEWEVDVLAINYYGDPTYDRERYPGRVWPAITFFDGQKVALDIFGRRRLFQRLIQDEDYDIVFIIQDPFTVETYIDDLVEIQEQRKFKLIGYFPIDAYPRLSWIKTMNKFDVTVLYTKTSFNDCIAIDPDFDAEVIPHGIDTRDFYPRHDFRVRELRREIMQNSDAEFLLTNVNRNQKRKDLFRSLLVAKYLKIKSPKDFFLYLHAQNDDTGGDIEQMGVELGLKYGRDFCLSKKLDIEGLPVETMNLIYNCSDLIISTSRGEGWGLSITEAFATQIPVVAPSHSAIAELLADDRGYRVPAGNTGSLWDILDNDNDLIRPLVDVEEMAQTIDRAVETDNSEMVEKAYTYVQTLNWDRIVGEQWVPLFEKVAGSVTERVIRSTQDEEFDLSLIRDEDLKQ